MFDENDETEQSAYPSGSRRFTCPHCDAFAHHVSSELSVPTGSWGDESYFRPLPGWEVTICSSCDKPTMWLHGSMVYPGDKSGPGPHTSMPEDVKVVYEEARDVAVSSQRSAAALLRLALQLLVDELVPGGDNLNVKIGALVTRGMSRQLQQAMDVVRVVGNNAVHPGQISLEEQQGLVPALFELVNLVVEQMIAQPEQINHLFDGLPQGAREAIVRRDARQP